MPSKRSEDFSDIGREEASRILSQWRMDSLQVYASRINFLLFTQSIFFMAFATLIIDGNLEDKLVLYVSVIMCIAGIVTAFIFGYTTRVYYDREFGPIDNQMEEIWPWFRMINNKNRKRHPWLINKILTNFLPAFFIALWVFLLLLLFGFHEQSFALQVGVIALLLLVMIYFVEDSFRRKK